MTDTQTTKTLWTFLDRSTFDGDYDSTDHCVRGLTDDPDAAIAELSGSTS